MSFHRLYLTAVLATLVLTPLSAQAEIVKTGTVSERCRGLCFNWWPKLTVPNGWHWDEAFSRQNNVNFLTPDAMPMKVGVYAGAQDARGQAATVEGFVAEDRATLGRDHPGLKITAGEPLVTADGQKLQTLTFEPTSAGAGNWDFTAYGEETDPDGNRYYLTFSISAPTKDLRETYMPAFRQVVAAYRK